MRRRKRDQRITNALDAAEGVNITPNDLATISLALQARIRDEHAAGRHTAAEAAHATLTKIQQLRSHT